MDYIKEIDKICEFIKTTFKEKGFRQAIIGISGGIDSAVVAALCVKALGKNNVFGYALPYGKQKDINDARKIAVVFDFNYEEINIEEIVNSLKKIMPEWVGPTPLCRIGNFASRTRANILFDRSAEQHGLVVGTSNKTELTLGYFTLGGDGLCALEPIGHLYKTEVFELAKYLNIPESIIIKVPTAGLWEGQSDEDEIGMTYKEIDSLLMDWENNEKTLNKAMVFNPKFEKLYTMVNKNKFKLTLPPIPERQ